jgi:hypothetical protein
VYILKPPPGVRKISVDVIWGEIMKRGKRKKGKFKGKNRKDKGKLE